MVDRGHGPPVVMIPGVQGRWEWMSPAVDALATRCRVVTGSLAGDRGSLGLLDPARGFASYLDWVDALLDAAGLEQAALCGVSYGGLIAAHFAANRPQRVRSLVLVSTPAPSWKPNCRVEWYLRAPRLMSPIFALSSPFRLYPEIAHAFPSFPERARFTVAHLLRVARHPFSPVRMAERVRLLPSVDFIADCRSIDRPTLVVTGTAGLDRVVPIASTQEYLRLVAGAKHAEIENTGHLGLVTKPLEFRDTVAGFVTAHDREARVTVRASA